MGGGGQATVREEESDRRRSSPSRRGTLAERGVGLGRKEEGREGEMACLGLEAEMGQRERTTQIG
jgi:hypothetical protein